VRGRCGLGREGRGSLGEGLHPASRTVGRDSAAQVSWRVLPASFGGQEAACGGPGALPMPSLYAWVLPASVSLHLLLARAEVKGGSGLTSPCQNPVESSRGRAGGWSAAKSAVFLL